MEPLKDRAGRRIGQAALMAALCAAVLVMSGAAPFDRAAPVEDVIAVRVRIAACNVMYGDRASPEQIARMLEPYALDIIGFNEVPEGDWTARVGRVLGTQHVYVGRISSANHKDKYKSILSRTPLHDTEEFEITAAGWNPAGAIRAATTVRGVPLAVYCLHISGQAKAEGSAAQFLAQRILPRETSENVLVVGDFNNEIHEAPFEALGSAGLRSTWQVLARPSPGPRPRMWARPSMAGA